MSNTAPVANEHSSEAEPKSPATAISSTSTKTAHRDFRQHVVDLRREVIWLKMSGLGRRRSPPQLTRMPVRPSSLPAILVADDPLSLPNRPSVGLPSMSAIKGPMLTKSGPHRETAIPGTAREAAIEHPHQIDLDHLRHSSIGYWSSGG